MVLDVAGMEAFSPSRHPLLELIATARFIDVNNALNQPISGWVDFNPLTKGTQGDTPSHRPKGGPVAHPAHAKAHSRTALRKRARSIVPGVHPPRRSKRQIIGGRE